MIQLPETTITVLEGQLLYRPFLWNPLLNPIPLVIISITVIFNLN